MNVPKASETARDALRLWKKTLEGLDYVEFVSPSLLGDKSLKTSGYSLGYLDISHALPLRRER